MNQRKPARRGIVYWFPAPIGPDAEKEPPRSRQWYLMQALSQEVPVVLITRSRNPGRHHRFRLRTQVIDERLTVVYGGFGLTDAERLHLLQPLLARVDALRLRLRIARLGLRRPLYWLGVNNSIYASRLLSRTLVYDCIDPCFSPPLQAAHDRDERRIAARASLVFATAETLRARMRELHDKVYALPNAYAPQDATSGVTATAEGPVGFMGVLDERIDWGFLERCAAAVAPRRLVLVGRVNPSQENAAHHLMRNHTNVELTGEVELEVGKQLSESFAVGLVPYKVGFAGDSINPVKLYMHLGAGTPVVGTDINELRRVGEPLVYAVSAGREAEVLHLVLGEAVDSAEREQRVSFALENTWDHRASRALSILRSEGLLA